MNVGDFVDAVDFDGLGPVGIVLVLIVVFGVIGVFCYEQNERNNRAQHIENTCKMVSSKPIIVMDYDDGERTDTRYTYLCKDVGIQVFDKQKDGDVTFRNDQ